MIPVIYLILIEGETFARGLSFFGLQSDNPWTSERGLGEGGRFSHSEEPREWHDQKVISWGWDREEIDADPRKWKGGKLRTESRSGFGRKVRDRWSFDKYSMVYDETRCDTSVHKIISPPPKSGTFCSYKYLAE
jgi:hypothetical protein